MTRRPGIWVLAALAAGIWTALAILVAWIESVSFVVTGVAVIVPILLLLALARLVEEMGRVREDSADLVDLIDEMQARMPAAPGQGSAELRATLARLMERQKVTDRALHALLQGREADSSILAEVAQNTARSTAARPGPAHKPARPAAAAVAAQPALPLEAPAPDVGGETPAMPDILRALNFPADAEDTAGFRAMRRAMADRSIAQVLRAAEDVLNLLAQDGIYTDDIEPSPTEASLWRRFAHGERGAAMAGLAGMTDASALTLTRARMRSDEVMRDAALHFMRRFDLMLRDRVDDLTDGEIERMIDSRSGRAFMLIAAVTGTFD